MLVTVLGIVWFILKIILWILLGLLGLVLLLLLMVLLVPIRYRVAGSKYDAIAGDARVTYLLRLFRVYLHYSPEGYWFKVKVLFFTVFSDSTVKEQAEESPEPDKVGESEASEVKTGTESADSDKSGTVTKNVDQPSRKASGRSTQASTIKSQEAQSITKPGTVTKTKNEKTGTATKQSTDPVKSGTVTKNAEGPVSRPPDYPTPKQTSQQVKPIPEAKAKSPQDEQVPEEEPLAQEDQGPSLLDKGRIFWDYLQEERNIGVLKFVLRRLFGALGSVLPKKFHAKLLLGLEDPATTAYIVGGASILYPKIKDKLEITGDFDNQVIEGQVDIKGRIIPGIFVWTLIRIYMDARVRRLIKTVMAIR